MIDYSQGIVVDAAHSQKNRKTEIQGVDLATGEYIFYEDLGNQTVNIGEFLAIVEAAKYIIRTKHKPMVIFSDSTTARQNGRHLVSGISCCRKPKSISKPVPYGLIKSRLGTGIIEYWGRIPVILVIKNNGICQVVII